MGKFSKGGPSVPPPPDPAATAEAQARANRVTWLTPTGNQVYGKFVENQRPDNVTDMDWTSRPFDQRYRFEMDPDHAVAQVQESDAQRRFRETGEGIAQTLAGRAQAQIGHLPVTPGLNLPNLATGSGRVTEVMNRGQQAAIDKAGMADWNTGAGVAQALAPPLARGIDLDRLGSYATAVDRSGLRALPGGDGPGRDGFGAEAMRAQRASFGRAVNQMAPQFELQRRRLEQRLADQGIPVGAEAHNSAIGQFDSDRSTALENAAFGAIGAGSAEQSRLAQLAMAARAQGFQENLTDAELANRARAAAFGETYSNAGLNNQARAQDVGENAQYMALVNALRGQQYGEALSDANLRNQAQQMEFNQATARANLANQANQAMFGNQMADRSLRYNELAALLGGPQVASPQAQPVAPIDVAGPINAAYQGQLAAANAQNRSDNAFMNGLFGLGRLALGRALV